MTNRNRKSYKVYVKAVKGFVKAGKKKMVMRFGAIKSRPGGSRFWNGYQLPHVEVRNVDQRQSANSDSLWRGKQVESAWGEKRKSLEGGRLVLLLKTS